MDLTLPMEYIKKNAKTDSIEKWNFNSLSYIPLSILYRKQNTTAFKEMCAILHKTFP